MDKRDYIPFGILIIFGCLALAIIIGGILSDCRKKEAPPEERTYEKYEVTYTANGNLITVEVVGVKKNGSPVLVIMQQSWNKKDSASMVTFNSIKKL